MKYSVVTFGCRVNQADSLAVEEELLASGAHPVAADQADLIVVNTCSVTATADQGARQTIRRMARQNPSAKDRGHRLLCHTPACGVGGAAERGAGAAERREAAIPAAARR